MSNKKMTMNCFNCKYIFRDKFSLAPTFWCFNKESPVDEIPPKRKYCMKFEPRTEEEVY